MRAPLHPPALATLTSAVTVLGVSALAADAGVAEHTVRAALRGERLNGATARALLTFAHAWEGATAHLRAA